MLMTRSARTILVAALPIAAVAVVLLVSRSGQVSRLHGHAPAQTATRDSRIALQNQTSGGDVAGVTLAHPLPGAQQVPVADASAAAGFPVAQPNTAVAGPGNLTSVWVDKLTQQVALVYGGGEVTVMMAPASYTDPTTEFTQFLSSNNATASLGSVDGSPALVISPDTDMKQSNPAWVEFDLNGTDVNVVSASEGTAALLAVAQNLAANGCTSCASAQTARTHSGAGTPAVLAGRVLACREAASACDIASRANVLVVNGDDRVIARVNVSHGSFRVAVTPGRYGVVATQRTAAPVEVRGRAIRWLTLGASGHRGVTVRLPN
jgi:hypothetical protein